MRRPVPEWVREHQSHPYPTLEAVIRDLGVTRNPRIAVRYSEPIRVSNLVRAASVRPKPIWAGVNVAAGLMLPILPDPGRDDSYRFVVQAELD